MIKNGKVRICITLDKHVYDKLCYECEGFHSAFFGDIKHTKSSYINNLLDHHTKILDELDLVKK